MPAPNLNDPLPQLLPIGAPVGDNEGGVQEIYLLPWAALLSSPVRAGGAIVGNLAVQPGARWYPLRAVLDTAGFDQGFLQDRNQGLYEGKLVGEVAEDTPALAAALLAYRNVRLLVLYRDRNDRLKLAGDATSWYTLSYRQQTQTSSTGGRAGYALELAGRSLRPALFYTGTFDVADDGTHSGAGAAGTGTVQLFTEGGRLLATAKAGQRIVFASAFDLTFEILG